MTLFRTYREDARFIAAARELIPRLLRALELVEEQANDGALWDEPVGGRPIAEAYVLQELRRLHGVLEGDPAALAAPEAAP